MKIKRTKSTIRLLIACLVVIPSVSLSQENSYLCISKRFSIAGRPVSQTATQQFFSYGQESEQKFIVNQDGLSHFGREISTLDFCYHHENGNVTCEASSGFGGWFNKKPNNLFTLVTLTSNEDFTSEGVATYVGECSKI